MHGLKRCLYALPDGINVLLKTLYMYRYDFEHAEQPCKYCLQHCSVNISPIYITNYQMPTIHVCKSEANARRAIYFTFYVKRFRYFNFYVKRFQFSSHTRRQWSPFKVFSHINTRQSFLAITYMGCRLINLKI